MKVKIDFKNNGEIVVAQAGLTPRSTVKETKSLTESSYPAGLPAAVLKQIGRADHLIINSELAGRHPHQKLLKSILVDIVPFFGKAKKISITYSINAEPLSVAHLTQIAQHYTDKDLRKFASFTIKHKQANNPGSGVVAIDTVTSTLADCQVNLADGKQISFAEVVANKKARMQQKLAKQQELKTKQQKLYYALALSLPAIVLLLLALPKIQSSAAQGANVFFMALLVLTLLAWSGYWAYRKYFRHEVGAETIAPVAKLNLIKPNERVSGTSAYFNKQQALTRADINRAFIWDQKAGLIEVTEATKVPKESLLIFELKPQDKAAEQELQRDLQNMNATMA